MSHEEFVRGIIAEPEDLNARGVYADWLTEQGDRRGEFIHDQLRLSQLDPADTEYPIALANTRRLEFEFSTEWLRDYLAAVAQPEYGYSRLSVSPTCNARFVNGFLDRIAVPLDQLEGAWPKLAIEPVQGAEVVVGEGIPDEYSSIAAAENWRELKVSPDGWFTAWGVAAVMGWNLSSLRQLDLSTCDLGVDGAELLLLETTTEGPQCGFDLVGAIHPLPLANLESLSLRNTNLGDPGVSALLGSGRLAALKSLDISQTQITQGETLSTLRTLSRIEELSLAGNAIDIGELADWDRLPELRHLTVPQSSEPESMRKLFSSPSPSLRSLELASAKELGKDPECLANIAEKLTQVNLGTTRIGDKHFATLVGSGFLTHLFELKANGCSLSDKGLAALLSCEDHRLIDLDVSSNKLTDAALVALSEWSGLSQLTRLRLGNNRKVTRAGFEALANADGFAPIEFDAGKVKDPGTADMLVERFGSRLVLSQ